MNLLFNFQMAVPHLEHLDEWIKERHSIIREVLEGKTGPLLIKAGATYDILPVRDRDALMWQEIVWKQWEDTEIAKEETRRRESYARMIDIHIKRLAARGLPVSKIDKLHKVVISRTAIYGTELTEITKKMRDDKKYILIHFYAFVGCCTIAVFNRLEKIGDTIKRCRIKTVYRTIILDRVYIRRGTPWIISNTEDCCEYYMNITIEQVNNFYSCTNTYICVRDDIIPVEVECDKKEMIGASEDSDYDTVIELPAVRHVANNVVHPRTTEEMLPGIRDLGWKQYHMELIVSIEFLN